MLCMQQVVDLQKDPAFEHLDVALLNIAVDPPEAWKKEGAPLGITTPMLSDIGAKVSTTYGVMQWMMPSGEPGHTFVLIDEQGKVLLIKDYGALEHGGAMYVTPRDLVALISRHLTA